MHAATYDLKLRIFAFALAVSVAFLVMSSEENRRAAPGERVDEVHVMYFGSDG